MFSAIGITAALAIVALSVNVNTGDPNPLAPGAERGATHVVAADGSGDFSTIQAAVDAAAAGDTVSVLPGTYTEAIVIDKDLTLVGEGPREDVVIRAPAGEVDTLDEFEEHEQPHGLMLTGSSVVITDLTVEAPLGSTGIGSTAGSPLIERVTLVRIESEDAGEYADYYVMGFYGESSPTVRDSEWNGYTAVRDVAATFEGNTISLDGISIDGPGGTVVRGNTFLDGGWVNTSGAIATIEGNDFTGGAVSFDSGSVVELRGNTFRGIPDTGLAMSMEGSAIILDGSGTRAVISDNTVSGVPTGIWLDSNASAEIDGNAIGADAIAIVVDSSKDVGITNNTIEGEGAGVVLTGPSDASISGNTIDVEGYGISVARMASVAIDDNVVCGDKASIWVADGAETEMGDNELCEDA